MRRARLLPAVGSICALLVVPAESSSFTTTKNDQQQQEQERRKFFEALATLRPNHTSPTETTNRSHYAWSMISEFDYANTSLSVMDVGYPSAIAAYYVTVLQERVNYTFRGRFPQGPGVYQCDFMAYTIFGTLDSSVEPIFDKDVRDLDLTVEIPANAESRFALQRFYLDPLIWPRAVKEAYLFSVFTDQGTTPLPTLGSDARLVLSEAMEIPMATIIPFVAPLSVAPLPTQFAIADRMTGLFPDFSHAYVFANPARAAVAVVRGTFKPNETFPYLDFSVQDQDTTRPDDARPFYAFDDVNITEDGTYEYVVSVTSSAYHGTNLPSEGSILRWNADRNAHPIIIMRFIAYDFDTVDYTQPRSPAATKRLLGDMYPVIDYHYE